MEKGKLTRPEEEGSRWSLLLSVFVLGTVTSVTWFETHFEAICLRPVLEWVRPKAWVLLLYVIKECCKNMKHPEVLSGVVYGVDEPHSVPGCWWDVGHCAFRGWRAWQWWGVVFCEHSFNLEKNDAPRDKPMLSLHQHQPLSLLFSLMPESFYNTLMWWKKCKWLVNVLCACGKISVKYQSSRKELHGSDQCLLMCLAVAASGNSASSRLPNPLPDVIDLTMRSSPEVPSGAFSASSDHELWFSQPLQLWEQQHPAGNLVTAGAGRLSASPAHTLGNVSQRCQRNNVQSKYTGGLFLLPSDRCKAHTGSRAWNVGLTNPESPFITAIVNVTPSTPLCFILEFPSKKYLNFVILTIGLVASKKTFRHI